MNDTGILRSVTGAAKYLGVNRTTVYDMIRKGLPFIPRGANAKWIDLRDIDKWLSEHKVTNGPSYLRARDRRRTA